METISKYFNEIWLILQELSPWLLFGLLLAGFLHVLLPAGFIKRHLGGSRFASVFKAVAVGVPMPLCSCGVIPTAIGLKRDGASDGAATGFLISTPQTGVDSILVSATFLGWPFAIFKVISALVSGMVGGLLVNLVNRSAPDMPTIKPPASAGGHLATGGHPQLPCSNSCAPAFPAVVNTNQPDNCCASAVSAVLNNNDPAARHPRPWRKIVSFGLIDLLRDIYRWIIFGVLIAALISTFIPEGKLASLKWTQGLLGMFAMLIISLPMYVCATASVPLAASLVTAGVSPGAALVFLMAGPTTNVATMGAILKSFGRKVLAIYLTTVIFMSIALGLVFNWLLWDIPPTAEHMHALPGWLNTAAALLVIMLIASFAGKDLAQRFHRKNRKSAAGWTE